MPKYSLNPLSSKSDQHQISPCNINDLKNKVVMRITDMITQGFTYPFLVNIIQYHSRNNELMLASLISNSRRH